MKTPKSEFFFCLILWGILISLNLSAWAGAMDTGSGAGSEFYDSSYVNTVLSGSTPDGKAFALVAGKHNLYWPYFHPQSKWDNILLLVGEDGFFLSQREIESLRIDIDSSGSVVDVRFDGTLNSVSGNISEVSLYLTLAATRFPARNQRIDLFGQSLGMVWQPYEVKRQTGGNSVTVDDQTIELERVYGQLETGEFSWFRDPNLAIKYDYLAAAYPDAAAFDLNSYAYVSFSAGLLRAQDPLARFISDLIRLFGSETLTIARAMTVPDNPRGVSTSETDTEVLFEDVVDLGLAFLQRQMIRTIDSARRPVYGLREIFTPAF